MTSAPPLDIKVVYQSSARKRRATSRVPQRRRPRAWAVLGLMNVVVAGLLCYGTWWRVDPFIYVTLLWKTPIPDLDLNTVASGMFGIEQPSPAARPAEAPDAPLQSATASVAAPRFSDETARNIMGATCYGWLSLATLAAGWLALAGGAAVGRFLSVKGRIWGTILAAIALIALGLWVFSVWTKYGMRYTPTQLRMAMSLLVIPLLLIGIPAARFARGLSRASAVLLILSAAGSVAALFLGYLCGAIPAQRAAPLFLAVVFLLHSSYAWILLPFASRRARR